MASLNSVFSNMRYWKLMFTCQSGAQFYTQRQSWAFKWTIKSETNRQRKCWNGKCYCVFYRLQNVAALKYTYQPYRHSVSCTSLNLQRQSFEEIFLSGSRSRLDWWVGMTRLDSTDSGWQFNNNTALKLENAADLFFFFLHSSRISNRVIQCDGFLKWQNTT